MGNHRAGHLLAIQGGYRNWEFKGGYNGTLVMVEDGWELYRGPSSFKALRGESEEQANANAARLAAGWNLLETLEEENAHAAIEGMIREIALTSPDFPRERLKRIAAAIRTALESKP